MTTPTPRTFDIDKWVWEITRLGSSFEAFQALVTDKDTLSYRAANLHIIHYEVETDTLEDASDDSDSARTLRQGYLESVAEANESYRRQMIVLIMTYYEAILFDFLQCIFSTHPSRMYAYLNDSAEKTLRGKIDLKEILAAESFGVLIDGFSKRAASNVLHGRFDATMNNLQQIAQAKLKEILLERLRSLNEQRNHIVHEASQELVSHARVTEGLEALSALLEELGTIALANKMRIEDQSGLVTQSPSL